MTRFYVEAVDNPEILDIIRDGPPEVGWTVISQRRYDHEIPSLLRNWLIEVTCPDAPASIEGMLVCPTLTHYLDGSLGVEYHPMRAVYPRLESGATT